MSLDGALLRRTAKSLRVKPDLLRTIFTGSHGFAWAGFLRVSELQSKVQQHPMPCNMDPERLATMLDAKGYLSAPVKLIVEVDGTADDSCANVSMMNNGPYLLEVFRQMGRTWFPVCVENIRPGGEGKWRFCGLTPYSYQEMRDALSIDQLLVRVFEFSRPLNLDSPPDTWGSFRSKTSMYAKKAPNRKQVHVWELPEESSGSDEDQSY